MSQNGLGNFNASDIIRRNQERMLQVAKMRNDYAKQQSLTIQPLQSGRSGGGPISAQFIPKMRQAAATALTVEEYTTILNGIITELGGGQTGGGGGGGGGGGYAPTGVPSVLYSLLYIVQGIVLDSSANRIILSYDISNNQYYIYRTLSNDPSGNLTQMVVDNKIKISVLSRNKNMFLEKTANNNYYIASYSTISSKQFPTIVQYDSNFNYVRTKVIRDASGTIMTEGGINNMITVGNNIFCSGWFNNNSGINSAYIIDSAIFPASSQIFRYTPFFIKLDSLLNATWAGSIIPATANCYGSACVSDSEGNIYASVVIEGGSQGQIWTIKSGNTTSATLSQTGNSFIAKYDSSNTYLLSKQLFVKGFFSVGDHLGMQMFVDTSDNIFVAYNIQFVENVPTDYTENFGNGVSLTFNCATKSVYNAVIIKLDTSLVPQAAWQIQMPSNVYNFYIKSVSFDPAGNLLINTGYTTSGGGNATITDNHGNSISLIATGSGFQNGMDISLSNDLTTVNWYFNIENIKTDEAMDNGYYRNNGKIIVDSTNNKLIKIDERSNTAIVSVAAGLSLPISTGNNTSFLIEYA